MFKIGIIGSEAAKFTPKAEEEAKRVIRDILNHPGVTLVSGHCHLGGVDIWAEEISKELKQDQIIYPAKVLHWEGGFKERNLQIASAADEIYIISVDTLPEGYKGMRFKSCYHCDRIRKKNNLYIPNHVKSGACWTAEKGIKLGKAAYWVVISNKI